MAESPKESINMRALALVAAAILIILALAGAGARALWSHALPGDDHDEPNAKPDMHIAGPRLDTTPQTDKDNYLREKYKLLSSTEWMDHQSGVARIPIDTAMRILGQRHAGATSPASQQKGRGP